MGEQSTDGAHERGRDNLGRERETAMRQILEVISQSREDHKPVFDAILANASRLCHAPLSYLCMVNEERTHVVSPARQGTFEEFGEVLDNLRVPLDGSPLALARAINECRVFQVDDIEDDDLYRSGNPNRVTMVEDEGARSLLVVPLISGDQGIGSITLYRREVSPFSDDDVALVEGFAAQAVIAIENVRQFRELRTRLEREAASAEILEIISVSRDDEVPVFDVVLRQAAQLCKSPQAGLIMANADRTSVDYTASWGAPSKHFEPGVSSWSIDSPIAIATSIRESRIVNIADTMDDEVARQRHPDRMEIVKEEQIRSILAVPLIMNGAAIGCFDVYRLEVAPFTDDEVRLLESFAAQAVIAIENVRQFKALEARTDEVQVLNASLEARVADQVDEIERMGRLKRFLPSAVADTVISSGSEEMLNSHRALLGVLFCDIRGFTAFCETAEPEETIEVLQTYHQEMGKLIDAHGAGVDLRMGDGIMVLFNDPVPCDDPAGEAVRLAIAMRGRMAELCKGWKRLGHRLGFGTGVSLGYATVGMVGFEGRFDYTASGTAVNLAARLCDEAADGEILLSPRARISVEDEFPIELKGESNLKGIREPVEVFRLANPPEG